MAHATEGMTRAQLRDLLTDRQYAILLYLYDFWGEHSYPATFREIGSHFGIHSTNSVNDHLRALESKKFIKREPLKSRSIVLEWAAFELIEGG